MTGEQRTTDQKWYHSRAGKNLTECVGAAVVILALGYGGGAFFKAMEYKSPEANEYWQRVEMKRIEEGTEQQRLRTIEELIRTEGSEMTPQQLQQFLRENNLQERK